MAVHVAIVKTKWAGTSGGPGITQLAFTNQTEPDNWSNANAKVITDMVRAFWNTYQLGLPDNISLTVDPVVDIFNISDGGLITSFTSATPPNVVNGTDNSSFNMASGIKITLKTGNVINRRRVHGGIFIVPSAGNCFDSNGVITTTANNQWLGAANTLLTTSVGANMGLSVWSRPRKAKGNKPAFTGQVSNVSGFTINSHGASLRGRRD